MFGQCRDVWYLAFCLTTSSCSRLNRHINWHDEKLLISRRHCRSKYNQHIKHTSVNLQLKIFSERQAKEMQKTMSQTSEINSEESNRCVLNAKLLIYNRALGKWCCRHKKHLLRFIWAFSCRPKFYSFVHRRHSSVHMFHLFVYDASKSGQLLLCVASHRHVIIFSYYKIEKWIRKTVSECAVNASSVSGVVTFCHSHFSVMIFHWNRCVATLPTYFLINQRNTHWLWFRLNVSRTQKLRIQFGQRTAKRCSSYESFFLSNIDGQTIGFNVQL